MSVITSLSFTIRPIQWVFIQLGARYFRNIKLPAIRVFAKPSQSTALKDRYKAAGRKTHLQTQYRRLMYLLFISVGGNQFKSWSFWSHGVKIVAFLAILCISHEVLNFFSGIAKDIVRFGCLDHFLNFYYFNSWWFRLLETCWLLSHTLVMNVFVNIIIFAFNLILRKNLA